MDFGSLQLSRNKKIIFRSPFNNRRKFYMSDDVKKGADEKFCSSCGAIIKIAAEICPKCGVRQKGIAGSGDPNASTKSRTTTLLLCFFLGSFGAHRFYVGRPGLGISIIIVLLLGMIVSVVAGVAGAEEGLILSGTLFVALGVWIFIDFIFILMGKLKDKDMKKVLNW